MTTSSSDSQASEDHSVDSEQLQKFINEPLPELPAEKPGHAVLLLLTLSWFGRYALMFVCLAILSLMALFFAPPEYVLDWACRTLEKLVLEQTGLPLQIGQIKSLKLWPNAQYVYIQNIRLYGDDAQVPVLVVPQIELRANLLNYLLKREQTVEVRMDASRLRLVRDAQGQLNVHPVFKSSDNQEPESTHIPQLPRIKFLLNHALLQYQDFNPDFPLNESAMVSSLWADFHQGQLSTALSMRTSLGHVGLNAQMEPFNGQGWGRLHLKVPDLEKANRYATAVDDLALQKGSLVGALNANWDSWKALPETRYQGNLEVKDLRAKVPFFTPLIDLQAQIKFNQDQMQIDQCVLKTEGSTILARGHVDNFLKELKTDLTIQLPHLELGPLIAGIQIPEMKSIQAMHPFGVLRGNLSLAGTLKNLSAKGHLQVPRLKMQDIHLAGAETDFVYANNQALGKLALNQGQWKNVTLANMLSHYHYQPKSFAVSQLTASIFSGSVQGQATLGLDKAQKLVANIQGQGLDLDQLLHEVEIQVPKDYRPSGRVDLTLAASGVLSNPVAQGKITASEIRFPESTKLSYLRTLNTDFNYSKEFTTAHLSASSSDAGGLLANLTMRHLEHIKADFQIQDMPLVLANSFLSEPYFNSGTAQVKADFEGHLPAIQRNWMDFRGAVDFDGQDLALQYALSPQEMIEQNLDRASIQIDWQQGIAKIRQFDLKRNLSLLQIQGQASVPKLMARASREHAVQGKAVGKIELADFPFLKRYEVNKGTLDLDLEVDTLSQGGMKIALLSEGKALNIRGIDVDQFRLDTGLEDNTLSIHKAELIQADDRLALQGKVALGGASPVLDLQASSEDFNLDTLVSLLPPEIRDKFSNNKVKLELPQADKLPNLYRLPQIESRSTFLLETFPDAGPIEAEELALNWRGLMGHWSRWKMEPETRKKVASVEVPGLLENVQGELSLRAQIKGTVANPDVSFQSVMEDVRIRDTGISESFVNARFNDRKITIQRLHLLDEFGGSLEANGSIDLEQDMNLEITGRGVRLKLLDPFLNGQMRLDGSVNFLGVVEGSLKDPRVTSELELDNLLVNKLFFDKVDTLSGYEDGYLKDARVELSYGDQRVVATGDVPIPDLSKPMDVTLQLEDDSFGLVNLFTSAIDWRKGTGSLLVRIVGTPKSPQLEGSIRMDETEIYLPTLKESVTHLNVNGELVRRKDEFGGVQQNVELVNVSGNFGGGTIAAKGSMDLLNLLPSYFNLQTDVNDVTVRYLQPGLFETVTPIDKAQIRIMGLVNQPIISGKIFVGKNGQTVFPFLRGQSDIPVSSDVGETQVTDKPPRFLFGGLRVYLPEPYNLNSPIFDVPVTTDTKGIYLRHRGGRVTLIGDILADEGTLYVLNNALEVERLSVHFETPKTAADPAIDPMFALNSLWNLEDVNEPVQVSINGSLSKLRSNELKIEFDAMQGLTESDLLGRLVGIGVVKQIGEEGGLSKIAEGFTDQILRGLFDPLTSRFSKLLGLEELSFGLAGQSSVGPVFKFKIRSNPFFIFDDYIDENLPQISFVNKIRLSAEGRLGEQMTYDLGTYYRFDEHWALDYKFEQQGSIHNVKVNGNYLLDFVLKWMNHVRTSYFGWQKPLEQPDIKKPQSTEQSPIPQTQLDETDRPSYSSLLEDNDMLSDNELACCEYDGPHYRPGPGLW